jgi:predicted nicotinamide N-methyase
MVINYFLPAIGNLELVRDLLALDFKKGLFLNYSIVGFCIWDASVCLAQILATFSDELGLCSSNVLELGTGSGLVSLSLLHHKPPLRSVTMTDQALLLKHIRRNLEHHKPAHGVPPVPVVCVEELEWSLADPFMTHPSLAQIHKKVLSSQGWDWIISSDCIYNEHLVPLYISTVLSLMQKRDVSKNPKTSSRALICFELRSDTVTMEFLNRILSVPNMKLQRLSLDSFPHQFKSGSIVLYCLQCVSEV